MSTWSNSQERFKKPVDMHVHIVGNGSSGSGCWLRVKGWHRPMAAFMCRHVGLPFSALSGDFDRLYRERLVQLARESSLGALVILAHEQVYAANGQLMEGKGSLYVPNDYVLKLAKEHPEFLPAVSIHPARADALEELERCLEEGAVMMKCLPNCQNIDCSDRRYQKFWERMAEAGLPLLAHTGGEHTVPVIRPEYSDPRNLLLPLECGVKVIAAHCATKSGLGDPDYFPVFAEMIRRFPNLYGDSSAFNVPLRGRHVPECIREPLSGRVLHGSDFPVPVLGHWAWLRGFISWKDFRNAHGTRNLIERDYLLKKGMGFSEESFTRIWSILRLPEPAKKA
ncbi:MAG TPA: amidohydrolase family protein [Candidatus Saccharimonadales bacterium]|nr:amidohydrolase family protein [Candidatus Saccharimonadales bacterium]